MKGKFVKIFKGIGGFLRQCLIWLFVDVKDGQIVTNQELFRAVAGSVVFVLSALVIIRFFLFELRFIPSPSMYPTLIEKDRLVVERASRFFKTPKRGDIMVFYPPSTELSSDFLSLFRRYTGIFCDDIAYIKRVIGLPGDKLEIKPSKRTGDLAVYINDKEIEEEYTNKELRYTDCSMANFCGPLIIPEKYYFMMGDNRGNSMDSRYWGLLPEDRFIGRAAFLFWPLNRMKVLSTPEYSSNNITFARHGIN